MYRGLLRTQRTFEGARVRVLQVIEREVPDHPFPHANTTEQSRELGFDES
jgi:hypothetical protein